jgi:hypothetical protein
VRGPERSEDNDQVGPRCDPPRGFGGPTDRRRRSRRESRTGRGQNIARKVHNVAGPKAG